MNIRHNSAFDGQTHTPLRNVLRIFDGFIKDTKQKFIAETAGSETTVSNIFRNIKRSIWILQQSIGLKLGGKDIVVQTDHSFKSGEQTKYNRGFKDNKKKKLIIQTAYDSSNSLLVATQCDNIRRPNVEYVAGNQINEESTIYTDHDDNLRNLKNVKDKNWTTESCNHSGQINPQTGSIHRYYQKLLFCFFVFVFFFS